MTAVQALSQLHSPGPLGFRRAPAAADFPRACGGLVHWASITRSWAPAGNPLKRGYLPATHSCAAGDTSGSDGLSPRPVAPSPVPPSLALSLHSGPFLYPQALAASGMGAGALVVPDPRGRVSSPRLNHPRGPRCEHLCPRGYAVTPESSGHSAPVCAVWVTE